jgi:endogenous inhibitor of DNA gyrase (YacG/DUF329 family)
MSYCPECGKTSPPERETGYDGQDFCSDICEERYLETRVNIGRHAEKALETLREKVVKRVSAQIKNNGRSEEQ